LSLISLNTKGVFSMLLDVVVNFAASLTALIVFTFLAQSAWLRKAIAVVVRRIRERDLHASLRTVNEAAETPPRSQ
jgi:hypothetical protein